MTKHTNKILELVRFERVRQSEMIAAGKIPWDCADPFVPTPVKLAVLGEEQGEVCRAALENDFEQLRKELIQTAAVAVAIVESLTR